MMKGELRGLLAGILAGMICIGGVFASNGSKNVDIHYKDIKVYKDGVLCELKDASGNVLEPFIYNGSTYLPVRAAASLGGMEVDWDAATSSVLLTGKSDAEIGKSATVEGTVLFDEAGIKIIANGIKHDGFLGPELLFYIENNSDKDIIVQTGDLSVNGFMVDGIMSVDVSVGKKAIGKLTVFETSLEEIGVTNITEAELCFQIFEADSYETILDTDKITITY